MQSRGSRSVCFSAYLSSVDSPPPLLLLPPLPFSFSICGRKASAKASRRLRRTRRRYGSATLLPASSSHQIVFLLHNCRHGDHSGDKSASRNEDGPPAETFTYFPSSPFPEFPPPPSRPPPTNKIDARRQTRRESRQVLRLLLAFSLLSKAPLSLFPSGWTAKRVAKPPFSPSSSVKTFSFFPPRLSDGA